MSIVIDGRTLVSVRAMVDDADGDPVTNTTAIDLPLSQLVIAMNAIGALVPAATTTTNGTVKQAAATANQAALTVSGADVAALVTSTNTALSTLVGKVNAILAALRTAGIVAP